MPIKFRSNCPLSSALDLVGDKWSLIIIRDMIFAGKKTFKEFSESDESIASNILSSRLKSLEANKFITKEKSNGNKKVYNYRLTFKGLSLTPTIIELTLWSDENLREFNPLHINDELIYQMKNQKKKMIKELQNNYKRTIGLLEI